VSAPALTLWEGLSAPWRACVELAWAAYRNGSLPIGAVIVDAEGKVIARGRNMGSFEDPAPHALAKSPVGHAELVALGQVKRPHRLGRCIFYSSTEPCPMCASAIGLAGVGELRYASHDSVGGGAGVLRSRRRQFGEVRVLGPESELLDVLLGALLIERTLRWAKEANLPGKAWQKARPRAAAFAAHLARRRILERYARGRAPAEGMIHTLEREFRARDWKPAPRGETRERR
jgi:tRNA(Arg) A34 adenosine deaminase TadA